MLYILLLMLISTTVLPAVNNLDNEQVPFSFEKRPLVEIIDFLAAKKRINIILPQNAAEAETIKKQTVTYQPLGSETVSLKNAWNLLYTFLRASGFSLSQRKKNIYAIVKVGSGQPNEPGIKNHVLNLYVNTPPDKLPKSQEFIKYVTYLRNLKVPQGDKESPVGQILKDMLSSAGTSISEDKSNALIIVDRSDVIASIMTIINELDSSGLYETIEVVPLYNTSAQEVVRVFNLLKKAAGETSASPSPRETQGTSASYFATETKIIADNRTNSVILMGRQSAVERISEFIHEHIDVLPQSGKSVLHVYDLQYLDAASFAPVLQKIVTMQPPAGQQAKQAASVGPLRAFTGVQVVAQVTSEVKTVQAGLPGRISTEDVTVIVPSGTPEIKGIEGKTIAGGNRLVIAALTDDWVYIKELIDKLDKPQPQVILEVAFVDFIYDSLTRVAATSRNKVDFQFPQGVDYLASHLSSPPPVLGATPISLAQDLLAVVDPNNIITRIEPGSVLVSFNDPATPGIWALISMLQRYLNSKIISHPFLVVTNNQKATVESQEIRRGRGTLIPSANGTFTIPIDNIPATVKVEMIPHLASPERLRLDIVVTVEDFRGTTLDRITRRIGTTAIMASGQVLAIGGLLRSEFNEFETKTPLLAEIPFLGWLFKADQERTIKSNITIFVSPTIVVPKINKKMKKYTAGKLTDISTDIEEDLFGSSKDPIVHLFLKDSSRKESQGLIKEYLAHSSLSLKTKKPKEKNGPSPRLFKPFPTVKIIHPQATPAEKNDKVKELLAYEDNPLLRIKQSESKIVFNG